MRKTKAQSVIEYFVIMTVILAVILSTGVIDKIRSGFQTYFDKAAGIIVSANGD
jgi:hypothetical protein